jgi:hypothetical protein
MKKLFLALGALLAIAPGCKSDTVNTAVAQRSDCAGLLQRFDDIQIQPDINCADSAADLVKKQQLADRMRHQGCLLDIETAEEAIALFRRTLATVGCISERRN